MGFRGSKTSNLEAHVLCGGHGNYVDVGVRCSRGETCLTVEFVSHVRCSSLFRHYEVWTE